MSVRRERVPRGQGGRAADAGLFAASGQELATIVNDPQAAAAPWYAWAFPGGAEDFSAPPPPLPPGTLPEVSIHDFDRYLRLVGNRFDSFERDLASSQQRLAQALSPEELVASQGQGLVAAMREVPAQFFQEGFSLDRADVWEQVCDVRDGEARQHSLERLSQHLDVVETHLVREIAARSDNFFSASGYIQDVRGSVAQLHEQVAALHATVHMHEQESGAAAKTAARLQRQRSNLLATLEVLKGMEGVAQAQIALQGLLPQETGMPADYVGVIGVLEVLQAVLDDDSLLALDCFSELPQQIVEAAQAVDDLMTADFLERARFFLGGSAQQRIMARLAAQVAASQTPTAGRSPRSSSEGLPSRQPSAASDNGEAASWAAARLADEAQLVRVAAWVWVGAEARVTIEGSGSDEEGSDTLAELLLPLVVGLLRIDRLPSTLRDFRESSLVMLKEAISGVVDAALFVLLPPSGDSMHLVASPQRQRSPSPGKAESGTAPQPPTLMERLQQLTGEHFCWLLEAVLLTVTTFLGHCEHVGEALQAILVASQAPAAQVAAAARNCKECCQAVAEAAAARWAKLLGARAQGGAATSMRLGELREVLEVTDALAGVVEQHGVRGVLGLRNALQQLCKGALDGMHARCLDKMAVLLEQEQWSAVEVHSQFQRMVERLEARAQAQQAGSHNGVPQPLAAAAEDETGRSNSNAAELSTGVAVADVQGKSSTAGSAATAPPQQQAVPRKFTITPHDAGPASSPRSRTLVVGGAPYHVVDTELVLLGMLGEYLAFHDAVPVFGAEVAQRVLELLKVFNSRTCQLVLGAGAMQVSGLKSITAKHLAVSCQCLGALMALHPALVDVFTQGVSQPRRGMLLADFGRALQDYRIHHSEVSGKLVSIMRERLSMNIKQLPALAASWPDGPERADVPEPSAFAATSVRQLQILSGVLQPLLLPEELHSIFGRIALMFSRTLAEAYTLLEPHGGAWEQQLRADVQALLNCLRNLPMAPNEREANLEALTQLFEQHYLLQPALPQQHLPAVRQEAAPPPLPDSASLQQGTTDSLAAGAAARDVESSSAEGSSRGMKHESAVPEAVAAPHPESAAEEAGSEQEQPGESDSGMEAAFTVDAEDGPAVSDISEGAAPSLAAAEDSSMAAVSDAGATVAAEGSTV